MKKWITKFLAGLLAAMLLMAPVALMEQNPSEAPVAITEPEPIVAEAIDEVVEEVAIDDMDAIAEEGLFELGADDSNLLFEEIEAELPSEDVTVTNLPLMFNGDLNPMVTFYTDLSGLVEGYPYTNITSLQEAIDQFRNENSDKTIKALDIKDLGYLTGLDSLTSLAKVAIRSSSVSTIDFSNNNELTTIELENNTALSSLTLGNQPKLIRFFCSGAKLTSLDVSGCTLIKPFVNDAHKTVNATGKTIIYSQDNPSDIGDRSSDNPWLEVDDTVTVTGGETPEAVTTTETPVVVSTPPATTESITIFKAPSLKKPKAEKNKVKVSWKKFKRKTEKAKKIWSQIKQIEVQISTDPNFAIIANTRALGKRKINCNFKGLQRKTTYYVRVRYTNGVGGVSKWSKVKKVKTK